MNTELIILVVEDEPEVLDAIVRDIELFEPTFRIEATQSAEEARELLDEIKEQDNRVALILCDHVLTGESGVDFMTELPDSAPTKGIRKILITGQAGHDDTIKAINKAGLHHYTAKPWKPEELQKVVRDELTQFIINQHLNPLPVMGVLNAGELSDFLRTSSQLTDL
jgi:response regulator RpfG family c-di-GMP phosphodiesterase